MNHRKGLIVTFLFGTLLILAACQQDQEPDATGTPPIVPDTADPAYPGPEAPGEPDIPDSDELPEEPYPAEPGDTDDGGSVPETPGDGDNGQGEDGQTPEGPDDSGSGDSVEPPQPGEEVVPVVPVISQAAGSPESLPDAIVSPAPTGSTSGNIAPGSSVQHTVIRGEWLLQVARCYGADYTAVRETNQIPLPDYITPGQVLTIPQVGSVGPITGPPCVVEYTIQAGDTWESIAQAHSTTAAVLQNANPGGSLTAGRVIFVPSPSGGQVPITLPVLTHNMLFINDGNLAAWRLSDSLVETTPGNGVVLTDIATNNSGQYVLARQTREVGVTEEIVLFDTVARTSMVLETDLPPGQGNTFGPRGESMIISADNGWGVYIVKTDGSYRLTSFQTTAPDTLYTVRDIAFDDSNDYAPILLFEGSDSTTFIVSEPAGIFEYPNSLDRSARQIVGIAGDPPQPVSAFLPLAWSPNGLYLHALGALFPEGGASFVIDSATSSYSQVPGSNSYVVVPATFWFGDGSLGVLEPTEAGALGPGLTVIGVNSSPAGLELASIGDLILPTLDTPAASDPNPGYALTAPDVQPETGPVAFTESIPGTLEGPGPEANFWQLQLGDLDPTLANELPYGFFFPTWVPDGSGLMLLGFGDAGFPGDRSYVDAIGAPALSLLEWLGTLSGDYYWVQP